MTTPTSEKPRFVVFIKENTSFAHNMSSLAPWGADVPTDWPKWGQFPRVDPAHSRDAWAWWLKTKQGVPGANFPGIHTQLDTNKILPYYSYLAKTGAAFHNFFSTFGTQSTTGHEMFIGGQASTMKNPPFFGIAESVEWDMPTIFTQALRQGYTVGVFPDETGYPVKLYRELNTQSFQPNIHTSAEFMALAEKGELPDVSYVWFNAGLDEHPLASVRRGERETWKLVDAVVRGGGWDNTVFMLAYDDWGGFDDPVIPPLVEIAPDGSQAGYGTRLPFTVFGGRVKQGLVSRLFDQTSVPKTIMNVLGLKSIGVPRLDRARGFEDLIADEVQQGPPPGRNALGHIRQPADPKPAIPTQPREQFTGVPRPVDRVVLNHGKSLPAPDDAPVGATAPSEPDGLHTFVQKTGQVLLEVAERHLPPWIIRRLGVPAKYHPGYAYERQRAYYHHHGEAHPGRSIPDLGN